MDKNLNEALIFLNQNLKPFITRKRGRLDYTTESGQYVIKIYKCGKTVTRVDIVEKEK